MLIMSCSSSPTVVNGIEIKKDEVLSRINGASERPDWLDESTPLTIKDGYIYSLGNTTLDADSRVEAGYRIAENNAKALLASSIEQKLDFVFQNAEEGTDLNSRQAKFIGGEFSNLTTNSLTPHKRYWEKVAVSSSSGQRSIQYRVFAAVKMKEADFKTAVLESIKKQQGKNGISKDFAKQVDQSWDRLIGDGLARTPTSDKDKSEKTESE